ncbi:carbon storage regulator [Photobacterium rosenbergii]|nr:carbon storage regulator [Photobacterium rosenbergii]
MLYLSRKLHESINIVDENNNIIATISIQPQRRSGQTSLGLEFQSNYKVFRAEKTPSHVCLNKTIK